MSTEFKKIEIPEEKVYPEAKQFYEQLKDKPFNDAMKITYQLEEYIRNNSVVK